MCVNGGCVTQIRLEHETVPTIIGDDIGRRDDFVACSGCLPRREARRRCRIQWR
jgi:hypothetical protein